VSAFNQAWAVLKTWTEDDEDKSLWDNAMQEATSEGETVTCPMCGNDNAMHMEVPEVGPVLICQCGVYHTQ